MTKHDSYVHLMATKPCAKGRARSPYSNRCQNAVPPNNRTFCGYKKIGNKALINKLIDHGFSKADSEKWVNEYKEYAHYPHCPRVRRSPRKKSPTKKIVPKPRKSPKKGLSSKKKTLSQFARKRSPIKKKTTRKPKPKFMEKSI